MPAAGALVRHGLRPRGIGAVRMWGRLREVYGPSGCRPEKAGARRLNIAKAHRVRMMLLRNVRTCGKGHRWTEANTRWSTVDPRTGKRRRNCRACDAIYNARFMERYRNKRQRQLLRAAIVSAHPDHGGTLRTFKAALTAYRKAA